MEYKLFHQDAVGKLTTSINRISFLAFIKHATFAGISHSFFPHLPFRYSGLFFEFMPSFFWSDQFRLLPELINDPTETAYISNRIGRAFADFLSKKLYGAKFTHSYECAMVLKGIPITGKRPDFYCDAIHKQFAVEAKGFSAQNVSDTAMKKHKSQSRTGPLAVNFSVASVAYSLYKNPKIKFYDPVGDDVSYDRTLNSSLRDLYFRNVMFFIESISDAKTSSDLSDYFAYNIRYPFAAARQILVHRAIVEGSWRDDEWLVNIKQSSSENNELYLDVDGIGLVNR